MLNSLYIYDIIAQVIHYIPLLSCSFLVFKLRFPHKNDVRFVFTSSFLGELMSYLRCVCLFAHSCYQHILRCHLFLLLIFDCPSGILSWLEMKGVKISWGSIYHTRGSVFNKGVIIPWMKIDAGINLPWRSKYHMTPAYILFIMFFYFKRLVFRCVVIRWSPICLLMFMRQTSFKAFSSFLGELMSYVRCVCLFVYTGQPCCWLKNLKFE
jgi:hypothetical protein